MKTGRRIEITVESHRITKIRRQGLFPEGWCEQCGKRLELVLFDEAVQAGLSHQSISRQTEQGTLHLIKIADGTAFICLDSLLKQFMKGDYFDENL